MWLELLIFELLTSDQIQCRAIHKLPCQNHVPNVQFASVQSPSPPFDIACIVVCLYGSEGARGGAAG
jgi:hypothetical protein